MPRWACLKCQIRLPKCLASNETISPKLAPWRRFHVPPKNGSSSTLPWRKADEGLQFSVGSSSQTYITFKPRLTHSLSGREIKRSSRLGLYIKCNTRNLFNPYEPQRTQKLQCRSPLKMRWRWETACGNSQHRHCYWLIPFFLFIPVVTNIIKCTYGMKQKMSTTRVSICSGSKDGW